MCFTRLLYHIVKFKKSTIIIKKTKFTVYIADTFFSQMLGLMHRKNLKKNEGMLFITTKESKYGIWMLNMKFSIDIIWLDANGRIVDIKENAEPSHFVFSSETFKPKFKAKYILEINSGASKSIGISIGSIINLQNKEHIN